MFNRGRSVIVRGQVPISHSIHAYLTCYNIFKTCCGEVTHPRTLLSIYASRFYLRTNPVPHTEWSPSLFIYLWIRIPYPNPLHLSELATFSRLPAIYLKHPTPYDLGSISISDFRRNTTRFQHGGVETHRLDDGGRMRHRSNSNLILAYLTEEYAT